MSLVRESHALYYDQQRESYLIFTGTRQRSNHKKITKAVYAHISELWDKKIVKESLYASSDEERFKVDVLPEIIKKLQS